MFLTYCLCMMVLVVSDLKAQLLNLIFLSTQSQAGCPVRKGPQSSQTQSRNTASFFSSQIALLPSSCLESEKDWDSGVRLQASAFSCG